MGEILLIKMAISSAALASDDVALIHLDPDNTIGVVSKGFCKLVGRSEKSMVGRKIGPFIPDDVDHVHDSPIDWVAEKMDSGEFDGLSSVPFIKGNGSIIYLDLEIKVLRWPNQNRPHFCAFASKSE